MSFYDKEKLERAHTRVRASMNKEQLKVAQAVDAAFEAEVDDFERRHMAEANLRLWAETLCGFKLDVSEIEELRFEIAKTKPGTALIFRAKRGTIQLYVTAFGTVDTLSNYVGVLEKTVIDITNNSQFTALSPFGLIKLAFKRFFKRSK